MSETEFGKILIYQNEKGDTKEEQYEKYDAHRKLLTATDIKQLEDHTKSVAQEKKS